jgi:hypothetical protein
MNSTKKSSRLLERIEDDEKNKIDIDHAIYCDRKPLVDGPMTDEIKETLAKIFIIHEKALRLMKESGD